MAHYHPTDTDDGAIPAGIRRFFRNRAFESAGLGLLGAAIVIAASVASWSVDDPSFNHAVDADPKNLLGYPGAIIADEIMQLLGLGVLALIAIPVAWAVRLLGHEAIDHPVKQPLAWIGAVLCASGMFAFIPSPPTWALAAGLGGNAGDVLSGATLTILALGLKGVFASMLAGLLFALGLAWTGLYAAGLTRHEAIWVSKLFGARISGAFINASIFIANLFAGISARSLGRAPELEVAKPPRSRAPRKKTPVLPMPDDGDEELDSPHPVLKAPGRVEPRLSPLRAKVPTAEENEEEEAEDADEPPIETASEDELEQDAAEAASARVTRTKVDIKTAKVPSKVAKIMFSEPEDFKLPPLALLAEPKKPAKGTEISDEVLEHNARMLEGVLDDFGVKGQIINVRPGPVVTLYELEPAPGIKSSRVISLADDIARSMSAISARVAVVQGRNAIGIELPNAKRETVYLRELLASEAFVKTSQNLSMALGKNIGGEPIFADLARMPHLLIAGTTGSGKSVGINTMILSLLYRHTPERCKLIMIDPKMLELSVYEGIPHLLAPVVTDPKKAVVALKWAVREMEDRYRKMSKVGVRNIDGYNARVKQAEEKGEVMSRTVQTGFDAETGEPMFEKQEMDMEALPFIVVIIDEMADLMMVAGKDIEGAVQRLAQMARAAGIHVVMATQRPSVDVITGTIKANFPTRISFQVTSKIDSRTILGEQGAEQLLGQGDMLYMAGGGRISRLHGPFVSDDEVENIVKHLKRQGAPAYVEAVTEDVEDGEYGEPGAMGEEMPGSGDELYDQACSVVIRDKKVSTSYIQRRLQVGYNKAASLIERMEKEGLISAANATGKREILVPGDSGRD